MSRTVVCIAVAVLGVAFSHQTLGGQTPTFHRSSLTSATPAPALITRNDVIRASLERIAHRSGLWRRAVDTVRRRGRQALVLTPEQVVVASVPGAAATETFDPTVLAEVAPVPQPDSRVDVVLVVVNLPLLEKAHRAAGSLPAEFQSDLDRILVHEIFGHALPYLLIGDLSGRCADPQPRQPARDACAIQRENAVRAELGYNPRTNYGLHDLAFARRNWP